MTKVRVAGFSISLDGFGAGPDQSLENPLGRRGLELHQWFFGTRTFRAMTGEGGGSEGVDEAYAHRSMDGFGTFILGRNMFGPIRGPWPDESWKGWWGANPPYHAPTFVLTHHQRDPIDRWFFGTRTFRAMTGEGGGSDGVDEAYAHRSMDGFGTFILGRNMFGPIRGPWPDESWKGWWGANPPYHAPTFVLTHHQRDPI